MGGTRCAVCGDARLSFFVRRVAKMNQVCTVCGGELLLERRRPGRDRRRARDDGEADRREQMDRRDAPVSSAL